ncbi:hypothetical protein C8F01DRAFT_987597 [Mycena amicta]|nr:hypothetical protein C8F01DRAFT_987597 [Mycena amicta]
MSDFQLRPHPDDILLNGQAIPNLEHADDVLTSCGSASGFQRHLSDSQTWSNNNGCETSIPKCLVQIFGLRPKLVPEFLMGDQPISEVKTACYLGLWLQSNTRFIWREQYIVKAAQAKKTANIILSLDRILGEMEAWDLRTLYMARIDPYLIAGCEICLDVHLPSLALLEREQLTFLRRMLGVGSRSMRAVLFSETGIWPIRYRRVYLALSNLCHLIGLREDERPAWHALQESLQLARAQKISWVNDLRIVLSRLFIPVEFDIVEDPTVDYVKARMVLVKESMEAWIDDQLATSVRTKDLLVGRMEFDRDKNKLVNKSMDFRHYLRVKSAAHRHALTQMVLGCHSLAVERRRWKERGKDKVPREWRLCRFCKVPVEDAPHALFLCPHGPLVDLREVFLAKLYAEVPEVQFQGADPWSFFAAVLEKRPTTPLLAKYAYDVLKIYDAEPMFLARAIILLTT